MVAEDTAFAVSLTDKMEWGLSGEDFRFMMELEPEGCFVLFCNSEKAGLATNISFGRIGWFGNLIVDEKYRGKGGGAQLVKRSLEYFAEKKVDTVGLYAYVDKIPFYKRLGFEYDSDFVVLRGRGFSSSSTTSVKKANANDLSRIIDFDCSCFGASRRKLLEPIILDVDNLCFLSAENGLILGYVIAKMYRGMVELGPLVCDRDHGDVAVELLKTVLNRSSGLEVSACVPRKESQVLAMLNESGFAESFNVARMFFGIPVRERCIYLAESLERG